MTTLIIFFDKANCGQEARVYSDVSDIHFGKGDKKDFLIFKHVKDNQWYYINLKYVVYFVTEEN